MDKVICVFHLSVGDIGNGKEEKYPFNIYICTFIDHNNYNITHVILFLIISLCDYRGLIFQ